jgi:hypothetical protein
MDTENETMKSLLHKAEFKILIARAHNAERWTEQHVEDCYICGNDDGDTCSFGDSLLDAEIAAWDYVHDHPEWED